MVKILSDSMAGPKIKHAKIMCIINDRAVRGRLSKYHSPRKFIIRNICIVNYSRLTVVDDHIQLYVTDTTYQHLVQP